MNRDFKLTLLSKRDFKLACKERPKTCPTLFVPHLQSMIQIKVVSLLITSLFVNCYIYSPSKSFPTCV